ncbi:MAG TPA: transporter associated domain-containing protein, partial [Actinotalea sp.]|nr:transporter associated domain-containing protein [Actinotalea sp.]
PEQAAYETLGGLVMARLGRLPRPGDQGVEGAVVLRVQQLEGRRVARLVVRPVEGPVGPGATGPTSDGRRR